MKLLDRQCKHKYLNSLLLRAQLLELQETVTKHSLPRKLRQFDYKKQSLKSIKLKNIKKETRAILLLRKKKLSQLSETHSSMFSSQSARNLLFLFFLLLLLLLHTIYLVLLS